MAIFSAKCIFYAGSCVSSAYNTGVARNCFFTAKLPSSVFDEVMALPYHIYVLATAGTNIEATRPIQYGTVLVLMIVVLGIDLFAIIIRGYMRKNKRW
jgi:phosphate transport system permease protein